MVEEQTIELEGTWEGIAARAPEFAGRRLRGTVLPPEPEEPPDDLPEANRQMLQWLDEWEQTTLTPEEEEALDGFERFRAEHPFTLCHNINNTRHFEGLGVIMENWATP